ncbi:MAG: hypothetical protein WD557_09430 [Dehalococcoidia bacterium]
MDASGRGWLSPKALLPAGAILSVAMLVAGVLVGWKWIADEKQDVNVVTCDPGPDCQARVPVHWHADFALFIEGEQYDFNQDEFFSTEDELVNANVHIHAPRINVVHVHRSLTTWDEFLRSIGFELTDKTTIAGQAGQPLNLKLPNGDEFREENGNTFKFMVDGVRVDGVAITEIGDLDRVLVSYGPETFEDVERDQLPQVSDEACIPSGRCLERGDPRLEDEPCSKFDTTCS